MAEGGHNRAELERVEGHGITMIATATLIYLLTIYLLCLRYVIRERDFFNPVNIFLLSMIPPYVIYYFINKLKLPVNEYLLYKLDIDTYFLYTLTIMSFIIGYLYIALIIKLINLSARKKSNPHSCISTQLNSIKSSLNLNIFIFQKIALFINITVSLN